MSLSEQLGYIVPYTTKTFAEHKTIYDIQTEMCQEMCRNTLKLEFAQSYTKQQPTTVS